MKAQQRKTGARALRSILEESMLEIMYMLPARKTAAKCLITEDVILNHSEPVIIAQKKKSA